MNRDALCREIIETSQAIEPAGLGVVTAGNVSGRWKDGLIITPSGVPYADLNPASLVELDLEGNAVAGELKPSSEWRLHAAVYAVRAEVNAVVHVHSPWATALACTRRDIPAFHYMVARAGGDSIRCADYATFGSAELAQNAVAALMDRRACLLANHGMVALGEAPRPALDLAREVEEMARQYLLSRLAGEPVLLDEAEMRVNLEKFKTYGRQD
ncbi:MAG: class II aldolase/adducin family protein [Gammaproteobacteria bacterium]